MSADQGWAGHGADKTIIIVKTMIKMMMIMVKTKTNYGGFESAVTDPHGAQF